MTDPAPPIETRARLWRLVAGTSATLFAQVVNIVGQIGLVPIFLAHWGADLYGEWLTLSAAVAYMAIADFGMQVYVLNKLTELWARGEGEAYERTLHSALFLGSAVAVVALALVAAFCAIAPLETWFHFQHTSHQTGALVAAALGLQIAVSLPLGLLVGIYRTIGEYPRSVLLSTAQRALALLLTVGVLLAGGGLVSVAVVQVVPAALLALFIIWDLRQRHVHLNIGISSRDAALYASFLLPSFLFFLIQVAQGLGIQGSTLVASATLGAGSVAVFVTLRTLANLIRQLTAAFSNALWPEVTAMVGHGQHAQVAPLHLAAVKMLLVASICAAAFLWFGAGDIVRLWTHGRITFDAGLMQALLVLLVVQTPWMASSVLLSATNNHRALAIAYLASSLVGLTAAYAGVKLAGLPGLGYGLVVADVLCCGLWIPQAACRLIEQPFSSYAWEIYAKAVPFLLLVGAGTYGIAIVLAGALPAVKLLGLGLAVAALGTLGAFALWLSPAERGRVLALLPGAAR